jgi:hypothetical protein
VDRDFMECRYGVDRDFMECRRGEERGVGEECHVAGRSVW